MIFSTIQSPAFASPKSLASLFPLLVKNGATTIDVSSVGPYPISNSTYYQLLNYCINSGNQALDCNTDVVPHFYLFTINSTANNTFDWVNNCILVKNNIRTYSYPVMVDASGTVSCSPGPNDVIEAQLVACYQDPAQGALCSFATACFEGSNAQGRCTKDFPAGQPIHIQQGPPLGQCGLINTPDSNYNSSTCSCNANFTPMNVTTMPTGISPGNLVEPP